MRARGGGWVGHLAIAIGRVFALVTTVGATTGSAEVYSGPAQAGVLRPVPGLSITGSPSYGDITTAGALQVGLGALQPRPASITAVNEITVEAAAPAVWALLADASRWPHRYAACRWVHSSAPAATCRRHLRLEGSPGQPAQRGQRVGAAASSDCSFPGHLL